MVFRAGGLGVLGVGCLGHLSESNGYEGYWILTTLKGRHFDRQLWWLALMVNFTESRIIWEPKLLSMLKEDCLSVLIDVGRPNLAVGGTILWVGDPRLHKLKKGAEELICSMHTVAALLHLMVETVGSAASIPCCCCVITALMNWIPEPPCLLSCFCQGVLAKQKEKTLVILLLLEQSVPSLHVKVTNQQMHVHSHWSVSRRTVNPTSAQGSLGIWKSITPSVSLLTKRKVTDISSILVS